MRSTAIMGAYCALLERVVPRLEETLYRKLERLDVKVTRHALRAGFSTPRANFTATKPQRPAVRAAHAAGRTSVIVLGARLNSDKRFCQAMIRRVVGMFQEACGVGRKDDPRKNASAPVGSRPHRRRACGK